MQRIPAKHRALGRSVVELEAREPQLLGGVVGSLLNPLVGGTQATSSPSSPQPSPSPSPGNGNGNGKGKGHTVGNGSGGGTSPPPASPAAPPASPSPSPNTPAPAPSPSPSPSPASGSSTSSSGGGDFLGTGSPSSAPANVGSAPSAASSASSVSAAPSIPSVAPPVYPISSQPAPDMSSSNTMGIAPSATLTAAAAASGSHQLSEGAIAGIVIVCLLGLLALILLIVRRRSISRRMQLREQWWGGHRKSSSSFSFISDPRNPSGSSGGANSRHSARSSFATNFDQGLMFRVDTPAGSGSMGMVPEFPPMAEVRDRNAALISTGGAVARRESLNSMLSNGSDHHAQYLAVPNQNKIEPNSPMSVRPFSPSESFSFPKPPVPQGPPSATSADSFYVTGAEPATSPQSSASTLVHLSPPPRALISDELPPAAVPTSTINRSDMTSDETPSPILFVANPDPFVDPAKPEFRDVEVIRRPFTPTLDDELAVFPGDRVRILQVFDDGWAFVEKLAASEFDRNERGLIPVDCLREAGQALPSFLAQKRVSSYGTTDPAPIVL